MDDECRRRFDKLEDEAHRMKENNNSTQVAMAEVSAKLTQLVESVGKISSYVEDGIKTSIQLKAVSEDVEVLFRKLRDRDATFIKAGFFVVTVLVSFFIWYIQKIGG